MRGLVAILLALILIGSSPAHAGTKFTEAQKIERHVKREWKRHDLRREVRAVMWCESRDNPWARNGQYLGWSQMGEYERAITRWAWRIRTQIRATKRYWVLTGRSWSPWTCRYVL